MPVACHRCQAGDRGLGSAPGSSSRSCPPRLFCVYPLVRSSVSAHLCSAPKAGGARSDIPGVGMGGTHRYMISFSPLSNLKVWVVGGCLLLPASESCPGQQKTEPGSSFHFTEGEIEALRRDDGNKVIGIVTEPVPKPRSPDTKSSLSCPPQ